MDDEVVCVQLSHAVSKKNTYINKCIVCKTPEVNASLLSLSKSSATILMTSLGQNNRRQQKKANKNDQRSTKCKLWSG